MLRRFLKLSSPDRRLLVEAGLLVLQIRLALWVLSYKTLRNRLLVPRKTADDPYPLPRIVWAVSTVSRYVPKASCLTQALAAERLLRMNGYPAAIHLGVAKSKAETLEAHAWVECQGRIVLGGSGVDKFTPLKHPVV